MRVSSRVLVLTAITSGAMLSATTTALAQVDGVTDVIKDIDCATVEAELLGECDDNAPPATPPAGNNNQAPESTTPTGSDGSTDEVASDDGDGGDDDGVATTGNDGGSDEDNGVTPVGGIETGAGGTADDGAAAPAAHAGSAIVAAGGVVLARRNHTRHARRGRHAL